MKDILRMSKEELLTLKVEDISWRLTDEEVVHIAKVLGAFWTYDYIAASKGRVGRHAALKSGLHSDGFFVSRILLEPENIGRIMSHQVVMRLRDANIPVPDYVAGVPYGATALGFDIAEILGARKAHMEKIYDLIFLKTVISSGASLLLVEDFCTRGTGFMEAVLQVKIKQPSVKILPFNLVIINRGGLKEISVKGIGNFSILPVVERRINDWNPDQCPLCAIGSIAIKPKITDENWQLLITSQLK